VLHCRSQLLKELDTDESGTIEFKEFLAMLSTITEADGNDLDDSGQMRLRGTHSSWVWVSHSAR
jgi:hypothetical protein